MVKVNVDFATDEVVVRLNFDEAMLVANVLASEGETTEIADDIATNAELI